MNAERLAEYLEQGHSAFNGSAAALLRRQHEAIVKLREALDTLHGIADAFPTELHADHYAVDGAKQALKDTKDLK